MSVSCFTHDYPSQFPVPSSLPSDSFLFSFGSPSLIEAAESLPSSTHCHSGLRKASLSQLHARSRTSTTISLCFVLRGQRGRPAASQASRCERAETREHDPL